MMKELSFESMEEIQGGSNLGNSICAITSMAWALGSLTIATGFGLILWGIGAVGVIYCVYEMGS